MMSREGGSQPITIQSTSQRPLPTITHDITEFAKWPPGARPVVDLLCRPLTATLADQSLRKSGSTGWPREALTRVLDEQGAGTTSVSASASGSGSSGGGGSIVGEAGPSSPRTMPQGPGLGHISTQPSPVTGSRERLVTDPRIFDALWAHIERMRAVAATLQTPSTAGAGSVKAGTPAEKVPTRPPWTALMKLLLEDSVSREESILWHNTPFVLPRPNRLGATIPSARQDEAAMLFVTHIQELLITSSNEGSTRTRKEVNPPQSPLKLQNQNTPVVPRSPVKRDEPLPTGSVSRSRSHVNKAARRDGVSHVHERSTEWSSESDEIISTVNSEVEILKLDVSQDGHIIPGGMDTQRTCVLPIVCVAGDGPGRANITSQITSVACQRYVWGIRQPTLGIEMSDSGHHARIFVAWVQEEELALVRTPSTTTRPYQIPSSVGLTGPGVAGPPPNMKRVVHIARASTSAQHNPILGFFDLSLPSHMLLFAQFVLGAARAQYDGIVSSTMSYADYEDRVPIWRRKFCWRSDHGAVTGEMHGMMPTDNTLEGRIRKWAEEVEVYRRTEISQSRGKTKSKDVKEGTTARRQRRATSRPL